MWRASLKLAAATVAYAAVHSLLASRPAKQLAARMLGERRRNAYYRMFFNGQALVTFAALGLYARKLPDRVLYEVHGPARVWMQLGRFLALGYAVVAARQVGVERMLGITSMRAHLAGTNDVPQEPEAQGPAISDTGHMKVTGPFRWSRHPLNFAPLPIFALKPRMTLRLATFSAISAAYFLLGSMHEEARLRAEYGEVYEDYRHSGVSFFVPGFRPTADHLAEGKVDSARLGSDRTESVA